jgi:hypothetical protein
MGAGAPARPRPRLTPPPLLLTLLLLLLLLGGVLRGSVARPLHQLPGYNGPSQPPHNATGKLPTLSAYAGGAPRASAQGRMSTSGNLSSNSSSGMVAVEDWDVLGAGWAGSGSAGDANSSRRILQVRGWVLPEG